MNVLAYQTQDPEKVAGYLIEKLHEELGGAVPIEHWREGVSAKSLLAGVGRALLGGNADCMYVLTFDVEAARRFQLRCNVNRQGIGCHVGTLTYATRLGKHVDGDVMLTERGAQFAGDPTAAAKLNAHKDLCKRLDALARTRGNLGGFDVTIPRHAVIHSQPEGALFTLATLGRSHAMGFKMAIDAKELLDLAALLEAAL
jgi:hypothetical protein